MLTAPTGELWQQFRAFGPRSDQFSKARAKLLLTSPIDCLLLFAAESWTLVGSIFRMMLM
jgi:hypothetical protein